MDKSNKVDFFNQVSHSLSGYTTNEIENGIIAYFLAKLGYSDNKDVYAFY